MAALSLSARPLAVALALVLAGAVSVSEGAVFKSTHSWWGFKTIASRLEGGRNLVHRQLERLQNGQHPAPPRLYGFNTEDWPESFAREGMRRVRDRSLLKLRVQRRAYTFPGNPCAQIPLYNETGFPLLNSTGGRIYTTNWSSIAKNSWFLAGPCINVSPVAAC